MERRETIKALAKQIVCAICEPRIVETVCPNDKGLNDAWYVRTRYVELTSNGVGFGEAYIQARTELVEILLLDEFL